MSALIDNENIIHFFRRKYEQVLTVSEPKITALIRQGETGIATVPVFDQHVAYLKNLPMSYYLVPLGVAAVGLKFSEPIIEFFELVKGLVTNVAHSILGKIKF